MTTSSHSPTLAALLRQIDEIYVTHAETKKVMNVLKNTALYGLDDRRAATSYIFGYPRCGKTETIKRFIQDQTGIDPFQQRGAPVIAEKPPSDDKVVGSASARLFNGPRTRILYADLTNGSTPRQVSQHILQSVFGYLRAAKVTEATASSELIRHLEYHRVDMLIFDETQQMFRGHGPGATGRFANWLLSLENAAVSRVVAVGSPALAEFLRAEPTANERRFQKADLKPLTYAPKGPKGSFCRFIKAFSSKLPVPVDGLISKDGSLDPDLLFAIYFTTRGRPGNIALLFKQALMFASQRSDDRIPSMIIHGDLEAAFDYRCLGDPQMRGLNPFRDSRDECQSVLLMSDEAAHSTQRRNGLFGKRPKATALAC